MNRKDVEHSAQSIGTCYHCKGKFTKEEMAVHLQTHHRLSDLIVQETGERLGTQRVYHILVEGRYLPQYWLYLTARTRTALHRIDDVLRYLWLECCGHLSKFEIQGVEFVSFDPRDDPYPGDEKLRRMTVRLDEVLRPGLTFYHEYDFGTTTELTLTVLTERTAIKVRDPIRMEARNDPPDWHCAVCGKPATRVCSICISEPDADAWYCGDVECGEKHSCIDDYWLPVTNSPRVGMCGYTGWVRDEE